MGETQTPLGSVLVVGVCVPWADAHVTTGRRDRQRWQDHRTYLDALGPLLRAVGDERPIIVSGDFNQRIPRRWSPVEVYDALTTAFSGFAVATEGDIPRIGQMGRASCRERVCKYG